MHFKNILWQLNATPEEEEILTQHFENQTISYAAVRNHLDHIRIKAVNEQNRTKTIKPSDTAQEVSS